MVSDESLEAADSRKDERGIVDDHETESDLFPIVEMPAWVAPLIGIVLVLISGLAVWVAVR